MSGTGKSSLEKYVEAQTERRRIGLELDGLLETRNAMAAEGPKMAGGMRGSEVDRDKVVTAYAHKVAGMDSRLGQMRFQLELLEAEMDKIVVDDRVTEAAWHDKS